MNIHFISLGCSKNKVDTEQILGTLLDHFSDIMLVQTPQEADWVFINTCGFLAEARSESFALLEEVKKYPVILLGCLVPYITKKIFDDFPNIRAVVRQGEYEQLPNILSRLEKEKTVFETSTPLSRFDTTVQSRMLSSRFHAYLKIAEGCDHHCSYCLIPFIRGKYRSKPMDMILAEATMLAKSGIRELILIAQDTSCWGIDLYPKKQLPELLTRLCQIKGFSWIRLHYTYPDRITPALITTMQKEKKIVPYLDIPFQHAHPDILKKMNRPSHIDQWKQMIGTIRQALPQVCLRTTFIVGFPGETKQHFEALRDFIQEMQFDRVGFFPYSREKGTQSYTMLQQAPEKVKQKRLQELMRLQHTISEKKNQQRRGQKLTVLLEGYDEREKCNWGRSYRDSPDIDGKVYLKGRKRTPGKLYTVRIQESDATDVWGVIDVS